MKVIVVGGGIIGVTTAYLLNCRGHEVVLIDQAHGVGSMGSFANGGLLTPSMADPWNEPGCWRVLLSSLGRSDAPLQLRLKSLPGLLRWGAAFLRNSTAAVFERNALINLRMALYSREQLAKLQQRAAIDYGRTARGSLRMFRDAATFDQALIMANKRLSEGLAFRALSKDQIVDLEPALHPIQRRLVGAILYEADETGDAYRFCTALAGRAAAQGVRFRFDTEVRFDVRCGKVIAVVTQHEDLVADQYVLAAGSNSARLMRHVGLRLPVQPVKGYSITFPDTAADRSLHIPVVDDQMHAVVVPLDGAIRVAGTAEFAGYDVTLHAERVRNLTALLREVLPEFRADPSTGRAWCGLRPMSVDGVPIIGPTPISNLFVNTGHGHLGWTLAAGSAQLLTDLMCGDPPSIDPEPVAFARFNTA